MPLGHRARPCATARRINCQPCGCNMFAIRYAHAAATGRNRMLYRVERSEATRFPNKEGRGERQAFRMCQGSPRLHSTVSRSFTRPELVSAATREKVLRIADGAHSPHRARRPHSRPAVAMRVALLMSDHIRLWFSASVIEGLNSVLHAEGYDIFDLPDLQHRGTPRFLRDAARYDAMPTRDRRLLSTPTRPRSPSWRAPTCRSSASTR